MALAAFSPGLVGAVWFWPSSLHSMKRLTAPLILALAVVVGTPSGPALAALTIQERIERAIDQLENKITVAPENRCAPYDPTDYSYNSRRLKDALVMTAYQNKAALGEEATMGEIESSYTGEIFTSLDEVDLDHIVALSEAHDSGGCAWSSEKKQYFVNFNENHAFASTRLNREEKQGKDWAEWQPPLNSANLENWCFAAVDIVWVKWRYELTIDQAEYDALAETLTPLSRRFRRTGPPTGRRMGLTCMALTAFSPGFMKRLTARLILALAVVAGGLGGGGLALAQTASRHILAEATHEEIEGAIDLLENHTTVAPENRCAPYDPKDYSDDSRAPQDDLIGPYLSELEQVVGETEPIRLESHTGAAFTSLNEADIDHLVALPEAHDSGACTWSSEKKKAFAEDFSNHELARPRLSREKQGKDWAEWQPPLNSANFWNWCFAAIRIVQTKWRYKLTVDRAEYDALASTLARCLEFYAKPATAQAVGWN